MILTKLRKRVLAVVAAILLLLVSLCLVYVRDYYHAAPAAMAAIRMEDDSVAVTETEDGLLFLPAHPTVGLIFYPGAKVACEAYAPLMRACAARGILCVLLRMPCNLAFLKVHAAQGVRAQFPTVERWYLSGHSLGGVAAALFAAEHAAEFQGLILMASYATADLRESGLDVLLVYGSEDGVMNAEAYAAAKENLPPNAYEFIIDGGCHAGFGAYGAQVGDGTPAISTQKQIEVTAALIAAYAEA